MRCPSVTTMTLDVPLGPVAQDAADLAAIVGGDEEALRVSRDVRELLAGLADGRRVDERHDPIDVLDHRLVEQPLVALLESRTASCTGRCPRPDGRDSSSRDSPSDVTWRRGVAAIPGVRDDPSPAG